MQRMIILERITMFSMPNPDPNTNMSKALPQSASTNLVHQVPNQCRLQRRFKSQPASIKMILGKECTFLNSKLTRRIRTKVPLRSVIEKFIAKLTQTKELIANDVRDKGELKIGKKRKTGVSTDNIISGKRSHQKISVDQSRDTENPVKKIVNKMKQRLMLKKDYLISASPELFGDIPGSYSYYKPEHGFGVITKQGGKTGICEVF
jgi:hypothetical protein